jgi:D-alanyl-D-alanine dipeptidase
MGKRNSSLAMTLCSAFFYAVYLEIAYSVLIMQYSQALPYRAKLLDLNLMNPRIKSCLIYATSHNFTKHTIYPICAKIYLDEMVAQALSNVQHDLEKNGLGLLVWDAYRPLSAQEIMWKLIPDERYVANPAKGGRHSRGTAVDVTLVDIKTGKQLVMPTDFDDFSSKAWRTNTTCSKVAQRNRNLLERVMYKHGFVGLSTEWWHFDYKDWQLYDPLNIPFSELNIKIVTETNVSKSILR